MAVGFGFRSRSQGRSHERFACVVVGAADVDASGFTVTTPVGSPAITAAKTAEGLIDVTLPRQMPCGCWLWSHARASQSSRNP